jgi:hypothetical protein
MNAVYLSAEAHGTLNALRALVDISHFEETVGDELVAAGLARRLEGRLSLTRLGRVAAVCLRIDSLPLPQTPESGYGPEDKQLPAGEGNRAENSRHL